MSPSCARGPELFQHPYGVGLGCRLDDPGEDELLERLVAQGVEAEVGVDPLEGLPQHPRGRAGDRGLHPRHGCSRSTGPNRFEGELFLTGVQPFVRDRFQQRQLGVSTGRADVVDPQDAAAPFVHDLHGCRARGRLHPAHERAHRARLPTREPPISHTLHHESAGQRRSLPRNRAQRHNSGRTVRTDGSRLALSSGQCLP